jgi:hypothetical protein
MSRTLINPVGSTSIMGNNMFSVNNDFLYSSSTLTPSSRCDIIKEFTKTFRQLIRDDNILLLSMYARLSNYVETIKILFTEYTNGNFAVVANILTLSVYQEMALELEKLKMDECLYPDYEQLRKNYTYAISGLYQSILQYSTLVDTQLKLEQCKERSAILNDPEKLKEYINTLKQKIFPDSTIQVIKATIKPEYLEYIKRYGYPQGNVFDPDKLANIINLLNNSCNIVCPCP